MPNPSIPHHPWIYPLDTRTFDIENIYGIQIIGDFGLMKTESVDTMSGQRTVQIASPENKRVINVSKNNNLFFSIPLEDAVSAEIGYCGENIFLLITRISTYLLCFSAIFNGRAGDGNWVFGQIVWASPYQVPFEFANELSISYPAPYSASWDFSGILPSELADFPRSGNVSLSAYSLIVHSSFADWVSRSKWETSRDSFIAYTSGLVTSHPKAYLKFQGSLNTANISGRYPERVLVEGTNLGGIEIPSPGQKSYVIQTAIPLERSNAPDACDISITIDPQYRDTGYFCMSFSEYNNLMARFPNSIRNINTTNDLLRSFQ